MVQTRKYSEFPLAGAFQPGDVFVGLQNGVNVRFDSVGAGAGGTEKTVIQDIPSMPVSTRLYEGAWVRYDPGTGLYELAIATNAANADVWGLVKSIAADQQSFVLQQAGPNDTTFTGLTEGNYFLSTTVLGGMTQSEPMNDDEVTIPVFRADSASTGLVANLRGKILGDDGSGAGGGGSLYVVPGTGFNIGDAVYCTGSNTFALADNSNETTAEVAGVVVAVDPAVPNFTIQTEGPSSAFTTGLTALTPGAVYWLQTGGTSPNLALAQPTDSTAYLRPCLIAITTTTAFILQRWPLQDSENSNVVKFSYSGHGLSVGDFVRPSTTNVLQWVRAQADSIANATDVWMVIKVDGDDFWIQQTGVTDKITIVGTPATGSIGYLSSTVAGAATYTEPTTVGEVSLPLFRLNDNTTTPHTGELLNMRPMLQPNANGGASSGWILIHEETLSGGASWFDQPTLFNTFSGYDRYKIEYDDLWYTGSPTSWLEMYYYVGGTRQTTGYRTEAWKFGGIPVSSISNTYVVLSETFPNLWWDGQTQSISGSVEMTGLQKAGFRKKHWGTSVWAQDASTSVFTTYNSGHFYGNTGLIEGFRLGSATNPVALNGIIRVYAK